jgi:uncharacterized membrane protein
MDKMLAVVFRDEKQAYQGVEALTALDREGSIALYALAVLKKGADGKVTQERVSEQFPVRTLAGTGLGSVIGILGGPVGVAAGLGAGALIGLIGDLRASDVDADFLTDVTTALVPGCYAVVADLDEEWVTPVDTRMEPLGGVVFRTVKTDVEDERRTREAAARRAELDQLKAEHAKARADRKAVLQRQMDQLRARMQKSIEQNRTRSAQSSQEMQAKVQALQQKAERESGDAKAATEARIARVREDYQRRQQAA